MAKKIPAIVYIENIDQTDTDEVGFIISDVLKRIDIPHTITIDPESMRGTDIFEIVLSMCQRILKRSVAHAESLCIQVAVTHLGVPEVKQISVPFVFVVAKMPGAALRFSVHAPPQGAMPTGFKESVMVNVRSQLEKIARDPEKIDSGATGYTNFVSSVVSNMIMRVLLLAEQRPPDVTLQ